MGILLDSNYRVIKGTSKKCPYCKIDKPLSEWSESKNTSYCKECWRKRVAEYRKNNKAVVNFSTRKSWHKHKDKYNAKRKLEPTVFEYLKEAQKNVCAICKREEYSNRYKTLCLDHCHETGLLRGLLCSNCNRALGLFKDNIQNLINATEYLRGCVKCTTNH